MSKIFKKLGRHIQKHQKPYGIGFVVVLFVVSALLYNKAAILEELEGELTGYVGGRHPDIEVLSPQPGDIYKPGDPIEVEWKYWGYEVNPRRKVYVNIRKSGYGTQPMEYVCTSREGYCLFCPETLTILFSHSLQAGHELPLTVILARSLP